LVQRRALSAAAH